MENETSLAVARTDDAQMLTKRELAEQLLRELFRDRTRITIAEAVDYARDAGVSRTTLARTASALGVKAVHNGSLGGFWELEPSDEVEQSR